MGEVLTLHPGEQVIVFQLGPAKQYGDGGGLYHALNATQQYLSTTD